MNGILPLWKPRGFTSHDCVMKIRRILKTKKVGHTGTLDPEVEGVLPLCIGQGTKIVPYLTDTEKTYIAEITLGTATETEDSHGNIIETKQVNEHISLDKVLNTLDMFKGEITQVPPMYSAVKVNGKKLYEYAREDEQVERPERKVTIHELELLNEHNENTYNVFKFRVICSKGTYIRTLCVDIGKALGYPAHMSNLIRTKTGSFDKDNSFTFEVIEEAVSKGEVDPLLSPIQKGVDHLDVFYIDQSLVQKVRNGQKFPLPTKKLNTNPFRVQFEKELVAIYQINPKNENEIKPVRVFQVNTESR